ncbi:MAG: sigma-70 family RNA polymerase sigma factor [Gemmatimonadetes bacterium]|nr:sigma-70 family RNA polymerase sigma factor [Gemmatimonadota bacterium]
MMELVELVRSAQAGDRDAFGVIVLRFQDVGYAGAISWLGEAEDARDVAQDAFVDAWESLGQLREPAAFPGWFRRIVRKHADRHKRRQRPMVELNDWGVAAAQPDALEVVEKEELRRAVQAVVVQLPDHQRLPLTLFHLDGVPQDEVAAFLDLPVSTVKKRIFDARKVLERRMSRMAKQHIESARPSKDDGFARRVDYFIALREGDVAAITRLLDAEPSLLSLRKSYEFSGDEAIPRRMDAATWAATTGHVELLELLIDRGAPVDPPEGESLLHHAIVSGAHQAIRLLIDRGADVGRPAGNQTPLHRAVMRDDRVAVDLLLAAGAKIDDVDHRGRNAADWAALKGRQALLDHLIAKGARKPEFPVRTPRLRPLSGSDRKVPVGDGILGHVLDAEGRPQKGDSSGDSRLIPASVDRPVPPILETGLKVVDLFCPVRRGGVNAISAGTGVGTAVVVPQIARNLAAEFDARIVFVAAQTLDPELLFREWKTMLTDGRLLGEHTAYVLAKLGDQDSYREAAETGFAAADAFRSAGHEVLLLVDSRVAAAPGVGRFLRSNVSTTPESAVTTLCLASVPYGDASGAFDTVIRMDGNRSRDGLYPAINPVQSTSQLLLGDLIEEGHRREIADARELLRRYYEHAQEPQKVIEGPVPRSGSLWHTDAATEDEEETWRLMIRGRRLDLFLTQPFHGTEMFTGEPGEVVPLSAAIDGCRRILSGEFDDLPEEAFRMVGSIEQAVEKAKRL